MDGGGGTLPLVDRLCPPIETAETCWIPDGPTGLPTTAACPCIPIAPSFPAPVRAFVYGWNRSGDVFNAPCQAPLGGAGTIGAWCIGWGVGSSLGPPPGA